MERGKYRTILASLAVGLWMSFVVGSSFAAGSTGSGSAAKRKPRICAAAPAAAAAPAPKLPPYFTATSPRSKDVRCWPDPTGADIWCLGDAGGRWQGRCPEKLSHSRPL